VATLTQSTGSKRLDAAGEANLLLKYSFDAPVGPRILFRTVQSVLHDRQSSPVAESTIGVEITSSYHQASTEPLSSKPGYVHVASETRPLEDRFSYTTYTNTGQIIPVNTGMLEVWWMNLDAEGVQWPSLVQRYNAQWPAQTDAIVIASEQGTGPIDPVQYPDFRLYFQNDPSQPGFNPNDEHAFHLTVPGGQALFALRNDLGSADTSLPYVLMSYRLPQEPPGERSKRGFRT
jgi:hypothetical protein